eukprot:7759279-Alexandrium_andersonii.AAC.1
MRHRPNQKKQGHHRAPGGGRWEGNHRHYRPPQRPQLPCAGCKNQNTACNNNSNKPAWLLGRGEPKEGACRRKGR